MVLPTQIAFLLNLSCVYPSLLDVIPVIDLSKLITLTLGSLTTSNSHKLVRRAAIMAVKEAVSSPMWDDAPSRVLILPSCLEHVTYHLQIREELPLVTDIILDIVDRLRQESDRSKTSVMYRSTSLLAELVIVPLGVAIVSQQENVQEADDMIGAGLTTGLMGILELVNMCDHSLLTMDCCGKLVTVLTEIVTKPTYPSEWSTFTQALLATVQTFIKGTGSSLVQQLTFDKLLWMSFFRLASSFISSPLLASEDKMRSGVDNNVTDMKLDTAEVIVDTWKNCPEQIQLVPSLVGPLLELIMLTVRDVRQVVVPVLLEMMEVEQQHRGNFKQMETELIDKLDMLINENKEDEEYQEVFNSLMLDLSQQLEPSEPGSVFVSSVSSLLEKLLDYRGTLQGDHNRGKRMTCIVNLLRFYKDDITRLELYTRYVYKLHDLHLAAHNFAEAAFTLQLHASQLDWTTRMMHADLQFPTQQVHI